MKCIICGKEVEKPIGKQFCSSKCQQKDYYQKHLEERREYKRNYYLKNKEKVSEHSKTWQQKNPEKWKEYRKNWQNEHREHWNNYQNEYRRNKKKSELKEMIYSTRRKCQVLHSGEYMGFEYYIMNLGWHPCAYIKIPENHPLYERFFNDNTAICDINLNVHGGVTYFGDNLCIDNGRKELKGVFVGWDYAHFGDYAGFEDLLSEGLKAGGKKWSTEEILREVKSACIQLAYVFLDEGSREQSKNK